MARAILFPCLLAALLLAQAGLSRAEEHKGDALDSAFLQSWLQLDAKDADRLKSEGAAAVAARRGLMQDLAAAGAVGEELVPGQYGDRISINWTSVIVNMSPAQWTKAEQNKYLGAVFRGAIRPIGPTLNVIYYIKRSVPNGKNMNAITVVAYPTKGANAAAYKTAAQQLRWNLRNGKTSWLDNYRKGSFVQQVNGDVSTCSAYCITCPITANKCTKCQPTAIWNDKQWSVYNTNSNPVQGGRCQLCKAKYCLQCRNGPTGLCNRCNPGYRNVRGVCQCNIRNPTLCADCTSDPKVCTRCIAQSGRNSVYKNTQGYCSLCTVSGCAICNANGTCKTCRSGFKKVGTRCVRK